jgi:hypothetical protein
MVADHNYTEEDVQINARFRVIRADLSNCEMKIVISRRNNSSFDHVIARILEAWQTRLSKTLAIFESAGSRIDNRLAHQSPAFQ